MASVGSSSGVGSQHHPSALRNRAPILEKLQQCSLATAGLALEIASGTGAHVEHFADASPEVTWQPSEYCPAGLTAGNGAAFGKIGERGQRLSELDVIDSVGCRQRQNVEPAVALDASLPFSQWPGAVQSRAGSFGLVYASNVCHISPWEVTLGLLAGAAAALRPNGQLVIYGPFKVGGEFTTESNASFDASLRSRDPSWGYRDVSDLQTTAERSGLELQARHEMPANNFLLVFGKHG